MIFEGSEKKLEIVFAPSLPSLRAKGDAFWSLVVEKSRAKILSKVSTSKLDAYLLSESSLFVWDDRILMITCGTTTLIEAADFLAKEFGSENMNVVFFQRKNEYIGPAQKSSFFDDVERLKSVIQGNAYRFGKYDGHHTFIFTSTKDFKADVEDTTTEMLFYDIGKGASDVFQKPNQDAKAIRDFLGLDKFFEDFAIDDFVFEPYGYSINAIKDEFYYTIHITPQDCSSYVSFETDVPPEKLKEGVLEHLISKLRPGSFDVVTHHPERFIESSFGEYEKVSQVREEFSNGFHSEFTHYYKKVEGIQTPYRYF